MNQIKITLRLFMAGSIHTKLNGCELLNGIHGSQAAHHQIVQVCHLACHKRSTFPRTDGALISLLRWLLAISAV